MASTFSWLDFSERERRQALDLIDQFRDEDTRDELGIGAIRDSFADLLFPGISTIQTRARYFLFVPWIYLELEDHSVGYPEIRSRARRAENRLIDALAETETDGVIGIEARENLKRPASNVYWSGLRTWGLLLYGRSQEDYHRWLNRYYDEIALAPDPDESDGIHPGCSANWHPHLPAPPDDFPRHATFELTTEESEYLTDQIRQRVGGSLLAHMVEFEIGSQEAKFPWTHPDRAEFPARLREYLKFAQIFSETFQGAAFLYNLLLAESHQETAEYRKRLAKWWKTIDPWRDRFGTDERHRFWEVVLGVGTHKVLPPTRSFVDSWFRLALETRDLGSITDGEAARQLIRGRERSLKGVRARIGNEGMLVDWRGDSGTTQLTYRWPVARTIIDDILMLRND
jgi:hypothetical protein